MWFLESNFILNWVMFHVCMQLLGNPDAFIMQINT